MGGGDANSATMSVYLYKKYSLALGLLSARSALVRKEVFITQETKVCKIVFAKRAGRGGGAGKMRMGDQGCSQRCRQGRRAPESMFVASKPQSFLSLVWRVRRGGGVEGRGKMWERGSNGGKAVMTVRRVLHTEAGGTSRTVATLCIYTCA